MITTQYTPKMLALIAVGFVLVCFGLYEVTRPNEFRATARLRTPKHTKEFCTDPHGSFDGARIRDWNVYLRASITSDHVLSNVVYRLELREKWARKYFNEDKIKTAEAVAIMRRNLEATISPDSKSTKEVAMPDYSDTALIDVSYASSDPTESALIPNTIAEVYRDLLMQRRQRLVELGVRALRQQLDVEDDKIKNAKENLDRIRRELNITDDEIDSDGTRTNYPGYWTKRENLVSLTALRRLISRKMSLEEKDLLLASHRPETILELAVPSQSPHRNHKRAGCALLLAGLFAVGAGLRFSKKSKD